MGLLIQALGRRLNTHLAHGMRATLEPVTWALRIHADDGAVLGDPYFAAMTVTVDDEGCATLRGFAPEAVSAEAMRATFRALMDAGMTHCLFTRMKGAEKRTVRMELATQGMTVTRKKKRSLAAPLLDAEDAAT